MTTLPTSLPHSLSLSPVTHRLSNGVATKYIKEFEVTGQLSLLFPKCPDEFQQMINVVLYNPSIFTFHYRMRQALLSVQMEHYQHFDKSQYSLCICLDILVYYNERTVISSNLLYRVFVSKVSITVSNLWFMESVTVNSVS